VVEHSNGNSSIFVLLWAAFQFAFSVFGAWQPCFARVPKAVIAFASYMQ